MFSLAQEHRRAKKFAKKKRSSEFRSLRRRKAELRRQYRLAVEERYPGLKSNLSSFGLIVDRLMTKFNIGTIRQRPKKRARG